MQRQLGTLSYVYYRILFIFIFILFFFFFSKSEEFFRILRNKDNFQNVNDAAKAVLCLDLAARQVGIGFNKVGLELYRIQYFYMFLICN